MKRLLLAGLIAIIVSREAHAQGPGNEPATLKTWMDQAPVVSNPVTNPTAGAFSPGLPANGAVAPLPEFQAKPDPNQDLFVTPAQGPWLICVNCYSGPESPGVAREMVMELRNRYKLQAYVFSKGEEERRAEFERVKKIVEEYRKLCMEKNLSPDNHMRVKTRHIENEYAVLVGGYPDADAAGRDLKRIRALPKPSDKVCPIGLVPEIGKADGNPSPKEKEPKKTNSFTVNPFQTAFVVHNPAIKQERPAEWDKMDIAVLKKLNSAEDFSLLKCKKPYTLIVKQFLLPAETRSVSGKMFGMTNPFAHKSDTDVPAQNARTLAELLHKTTHLDAYVLHTKYASMVTVGAFESPEDPALRSTQEMLRNQYKIPLPVAMPVPR